LARARHAVELDPEESRCHRALAFIWLNRREYDTAEYHYQVALDLNPNDADVRMGVGYLHAVRGRPEEAMALMQSARLVDIQLPSGGRALVVVASKWRCVMTPV
jgi:adenylate cyclase